MIRGTSIFCWFCDRARMHIFYALEDQYVTAGRGLLLITVILIARSASCTPALLQGMPSNLECLPAPHEVVERRRVIAFGAPLLARLALGVFVVLADGISLHKSQESNSQDNELDGDHVCKILRGVAMAVHVHVCAQRAAAPV